jgi:hypothetical protein
MLTGWDATELQNFKLEDGTTYAAVVALLNAGLGALNTEFASDWMTSLYSLTDQPDLEYRVGVSNGMEDHTEYGLPDAKRAETEGHMLPLKQRDRMLGWTWDYMREARMPQIEADVADALKDVRDKRRQRVLRRLIKRGDDSGTALKLGSSGLSPGFATTAGSTGVDFTPPANEGTTFANTHEHYIPIAGGVFTNAVFTDAYDELREHGHEPPFDFLIGPDDRATVEGLSKFTSAADNLIIYGLTQDRARVPGEYIGTIEHFMVREVRGMPQYYGFGYKSYGRLSRKNPLRVRLHKGESAFRALAMPHPNAGSGIIPLQNLMLFAEFGIGVYDRTNGTARYVNNATWADGTAV